MQKMSAGILPYRRRGGRIQVLLVHPGGPFWAKKDRGAWSIAKGEYRASESPLDAALREFTEETGHAPKGPFEPLARIRQPSVKVVDAWATENESDFTDFVSNTFTMEWPKGSGKMQSFPEVDRVEWLDIVVAAGKIVPGQLGFLQELHRRLTGSPIDLTAAESPPQSSPRTLPFGTSDEHSRGK